MYTSNTNPVEEHPEIQPGSGHSPIGEAIPHITEHPQIEVDRPSGLAIPGNPERPSSGDQPFAPAMEALARLEREDRSLPKHMEGNKLAKANDALKETHRKLLDEKNRMQSCHDDQIARLRFFDQALESSRLRLTDILKEWNRYSDGLESKLSE
ncbi:uncharacterized protein N7496_005694 [Penicillium cataractarum]|uniref:Uncharacterized protein n=1 Tax=Penicillium cataractarum TaxID=2100454 RepID=A0A9W9SHV4_9EURO|nr:uncharacterized protein N7496_005694 [Penicillium cataractarum]KAJ5378285.1 hypothetical protein N7496_005694 [Penicillium cataractarum]